MRKKDKIITCLLGFISSSAFSYETEFENHLSVGLAQMKADQALANTTIEGVGAAYTLFKKDSEWGVTGYFEYAASNDSVNSLSIGESMWNVMLGVTFRPVDLQWIRFSPMLGVANYNLDLDSPNGKNKDSQYGVSFGLGMQVDIPKTSYFVESNYKVIDINGEYSHVDISTLYLGVGYKF
ncbi:outer membrane beta-barrel protein [Photobacterium swingsii]|uniref:outer membrane beta-barrel protein n=1 Tax=Photobacterium swingsii TaxID=680026 RepID=UPI0040678850